MRRKSFEGKAEDVVYEIDRSLKEKAKEEKKAYSPVAKKRNQIELKPENRTLKIEKRGLEKSVLEESKGVKF